LKPAAFEYHRPRTTEEAVSLLRQFGPEAKLLAGGQSLMPLMNFRLAQPAHLIDINFIDGRGYIRRENGSIKIGCLMRQSRALNEPLVREYCPLLAEALAQVGYEQTRNRGTVCGSIAHADPAAELPAVLLALDGAVTVKSEKATRSIPARDFFLSYLTTNVASDEMVMEVTIPETRPHSGWSFLEFARRFGDFAIVGVAAMLTIEHDRISDARLGLIGVGDKPWRDDTIERMVVGQIPSADLFAAVGSEVAARIEPAADIHASESYRRSLARVLTKRALVQAWKRAGDATVR
jgi:aerobic carbon-monoxide dehydrogenase medium subunit